MKQLGTFRRIFTQQIERNLAENAKCINDMPRGLTRASLRELAFKLSEEMEQHFQLNSGYYKRWESQYQRKVKTTWIALGATEIILLNCYQTSVHRDGNKNKMSEVCFNNKLFTVNKNSFRNASRRLPAVCKTRQQRSDPSNVSRSFICKYLITVWWISVVQCHVMPTVTCRLLQWAYTWE